MKFECSELHRTW